MADWTALAAAATKKAGDAKKSRENIIVDVVDAMERRLVASPHDPIVKGIRIVLGIATGDIPEEFKAAAGATNGTTGTPGAPLALGGTGTTGLPMFIDCVDMANPGIIVWKARRDNNDDYTRAMGMGFMPIAPDGVNVERFEKPVPPATPAQKYKVYTKRNVYTGEEITETEAAARGLKINRDPSGNITGFQHKR
jgi:hypothetical protein